MAKTITVQTIIHFPIEKVWLMFTSPEHIVHWYFASDDWEASSADNDLRVSGKFNIFMAAKDRSFSFNFNGTYTKVQKHKYIAYTIEGGRKVTIDFESTGNSTKVTETFEMEQENSEELQRTGWQAILDNFKKYVEKTKTNNKESSRR